jgi:hypothetical protein
VQTLDRKDAERDAKGRRLLSKIPALLPGEITNKWHDITSPQPALSLPMFDQERLGQTPPAHNQEDDYRWLNAGTHNR